MINSEYQSQLNLSYSLHPIISQLNMDLVRQNPFNPLQFIKLWAANKLKEIYDYEDDDQEDLQEFDNNKRQIFHPDKKTLHNRDHHPSSFFAQTGKIPVLQIKRRSAVFFFHEETSKICNQIPKSQQTKSRIMISLKNDIFFQNKSWEEIETFVQKGKVFETQEQNEIIQPIDEPITQFFIVVSGEIMRQTREGQPVNTYYTGECLCHQSFLHPNKSKYSYLCQQPKTIIFTLSGSQIRNHIQSLAQEKFLFYQKMLMNKEEFNYLDDEEKDKLIACFKSRKQVMEGEVVFRGQQGTVAQKRIYVVIKGQFSKCKKNLSGELMPFKTLREGDFFGEQNLHSFPNIDYIVICIQDNSEIAFMEKNSFEQSVDSYQRIVQRAKMQVKYGGN